MIGIFEDKWQRNNVSLGDNRPDWAHIKVGNFQATNTYLFNGIRLTAKRSCFMCAFVCLYKSFDLSTWVESIISMLGIMKLAY